MSRCGIILLVGALGACVAGAARAAEPLVTDRPDFTESALLVGVGAAVRF